MNIKGYLVQYIEQKQQLNELYLTKVTKEIQSFMFKSDTITKVSFVIQTVYEENGDVTRNIFDFTTDAAFDELEYAYSIYNAISEALPLFAEIVGSGNYRFEINPLGPPIINIVCF